VVAATNDNRDVQHDTPPLIDEVAVLSAIDDALPIVYHYFVRRIGSVALAEDLTSETMLAAVAEVTHRGFAIWSLPWLIGVARHKLADHWRRLERERRHLAIGGEFEEAAWDQPIETGRVEAVLAQLNPSQRAALTWRYVDDLSTSEVAGLLGRSIAATENLLARSRRAFRDLYEGSSDE
jgi:RNA polymerase sigma-70 factor, ECF subfamily